MRRKNLGHVPTSVVVFTQRKSHPFLAYFVKFRRFSLHKTFTVKLLANFGHKKPQKQMSDVKLAQFFAHLEKDLLGLC